MAAVVDHAAAANALGANAHRTRRALARSLLLPLLLVGLAGGLRLYHLGTPDQTYWDEHFYALDAYAYLGGMIPPPDLKLPPAPTIYADTSWMHPPLGKLIIAVGESPTNYSTLGSRLPSALFGTAGVLIVYLIGLELWGASLWAGLAALLVAVDGLHIVQSRIAMLDIFLTTLVSAGALFLVRDRKRIAAGYGPPTPRTLTRIERLFGTKERFWAGAMFGAAAAVKWNGAWPLALGAILTAAWTRRSVSSRDGRRKALRTVGLAYLFVPALIYVLSYTQFFIQHPIDVFGWVRLQWYMLQGLRHGHFTHPASSPPWSWPLLLHPIPYWVHATATGVDSTKGSIGALGNPVLWWGFLASLPVAGYRVIRRRDRDLGLVLAFYGVLFLPWFAVARTQYIYYALPCVPFMALALTATVQALAKRNARAAGWLVAILAVGVGAAFLPIWLGLPTSSKWLAHLRWLPRWP